MDLPNRKNNRLENFDYGKNGMYFITICTQNRRKILCEIVGGGALDAPKIKLSETGEIAEKYILSTNNIPEITVDKYVIMPDHIHLLLWVRDINGTSKAPSPTNNLISHSISTLKRFINKDVGYNIFQRSYYDHVIRNQHDYDETWKYIDNNPINWIIKHKNQ